MYKYTNLGKRGIKYINKWCYVFTVWVIAFKIKYWTVVSYRGETEMNIYL